MNARAVQGGWGQHFITHLECHGISHHEHLIDHLEDMREKGTEQWVEEQEAKSRCSNCGLSLDWCSRKCPNCHEPVKR